MEVVIVIVALVLFLAGMTWFVGKLNAKARDQWNVIGKGVINRVDVIYGGNLYFFDRTVVSFRDEPSIIIDGNRDKDFEGFKPGDKIVITQNDIKELRVKKCHPVMQHNSEVPDAGNHQ